MSAVSTLVGKVRPSRSAPASPAASGPAAGYKPSALLMPPRVMDNRAKASTSRKALLVAGAVLGAAGLATAGLLVTTAASNAELKETTASNDALLARTSALAPVGSFYRGFDARQGAVADQLVSDVDYAAVLAQITAAVPPDASVTSLVTDFGTTCAGPDPYRASPGLGCVTLTASAPGLDSAGLFVSNVETLPEGGRVVIDPYVTRNEVTPSSAGEAGAVEFTSTINFTSSALSSRFADLMPAKDDSATLDTTGPAPTATEEATS